MINLLGWLGAVLVVLGRACIAYKRRIGFLAAVVGGIAIGVQAYLMDNWSVVLMAVILGVIDGFGLIYWKYGKNKFSSP